MRVSQLPAAEQDFLRRHHVAAMLTVGTDGRPKAAKMEPAVVDDQLLSIGHRHKVRTRRLHRDPRATLFYDAPGPTWLAIEATVGIIDNSDTPKLIVDFMRVRQQRPTGPLAWHGDNHIEVELDDTTFMHTMTSEGCILYHFDIDKMYGNLHK
ncbi:pyridoxamine 5'-phosphate oxidase family protein [Mycolicibacter icosiumassiliensis]|uniref:pyridoxamine 5'-phosphate oxidase family protein n=1 Tax=Mycolicibacter icosiumassiliensis TaxID=1792835 RepID=UPI00098EA1B6|nr:pyridoxamine 5'-phosphate oxidase family protein [Mycolicibacter icosiumassiliensis]